MSGFADRLKERVRTRSLHSKGQSSSNIIDDQPYISGAVQNTSINNPSPSPRISLENSAFIVQSEAARPQRKHGHQKSVEQRTREDATVADIVSKSRKSEDRTALVDILNEIIPDRESSLTKSRDKRGVASSSHARHPSLPTNPTDHRNIPDRGSSSRHPPSGQHKRAIHPSQGRNIEQQIPHLAIRKQSSGQREAPINQSHMNSWSLDYGSSLPAHSFEPTSERHIPYTNNLSDQNAKPTLGAMPQAIPVRSKVRTPQTQRSSQPQTQAYTEVKQNVHPSDNLRLPQSFDLQNTEQTHVTESWRPAVTHETIVKKRTEIVHEEITRDIHIHHYYTYLQPIKVVEILPARHYLIDEKTGMKREIPAPEGWKLPASMQPTTPDTSMIKGWTRNYLVNEQYPNGILEHGPGIINGEVSAIEATTGASPPMR